nr:hypothetical protein CFP56_29017 [Quercus suber]
MDSVLEKGPWFIGDFFLSLRPWEPFFKPSTANVSLIAVWVRLNELPIELYETKVLKQIGKGTGTRVRKIVPTWWGQANPLGKLHLITLVTIWIGWRKAEMDRQKAQSPTCRRPNSEYSKSNENIPASSAELAGNTDGLPLIPGLGTKVLSPTPKMNPSSRQLPASVKGKKNLARIKTSYSFYKSTAAPQSKERSLNSPFSFTNLATLSNHDSKPSSNVTFKFKTLARDEMGHMTRGGNDRDTGDCYRRDSGKSHACNGKFQSQVKGSLEINFLANRGNLEIGVPAIDRPTIGANGKSMVAISVGWIDARGGMENCLANLTPTFTDPTLVRSESYRSSI